MRYLRAHPSARTRRGTRSRGTRRPGSRRERRVEIGARRDALEVLPGVIAGRPHEERETKSRRLQIGQRGRGRQFGAPHRAHARGAHAGDLPEPGGVACATGREHLRGRVDDRRVAARDEPLGQVQRPGGRVGVGDRVEHEVVRRQRLERIEVFDDERERDEEAIVQMALDRNVVGVLAAQQQHAHRRSGALIARDRQRTRRHPELPVAVRRAGVAVVLEERGQAVVGERHLRVAPQRRFVIAPRRPGVSRLQSQVAQVRQGRRLVGVPEERRGEHELGFIGLAGFEQQRSGAGQQARLRLVHGLVFGNKNSNSYR